MVVDEFLVAEKEVLLKKGHSASHSVTVDLITIARWSLRKKLFDVQFGTSVCSLNSTKTLTRLAPQN